MSCIDHFVVTTNSDGFETRHHQNRQKSLKTPKGIMRRCKSKKDVQCNGLDNKAKQWSTKHCKDN